jgi:hypothetical protein
VTDVGIFQIKTMKLYAARWRIEVNLEGGLIPHLKDFPATLFDFGDSECVAERNCMSLSWTILSAQFREEK